MAKSCVPKARVMIVDDHAVVRQGTRNMLQAHAGIDVVGETASGENLEGLIRLRQPDVVLLDIHLPGDNGLDILQRLRREFPALKILLFSAHVDPQYIRRGLALQANGYLSKTISQEALQTAIVSLMAVSGTHEPVLCEETRRKLGDGEHEARQAGLSAREHEVLLLVAQGQTNRAIADALVVSVKTVDSHVASLIRKLSASNRAQLTAYAYEQGLL